MQFTGEFSFNGICKVINEKDNLELVTDEKKNQAHTGLFDYLEYNAGISFCEMRSSYKLKQNTFQCGLGPDQYFELEDKSRQLFMTKVCESLQETITREIPKQALSSGTTALFTVSKRFKDQLHIDMAHLGGSLAFLIIENSKEVLSCEPLNTTRHLAGERAESERLLKLGHVVVGGQMSKQLPYSRILGFNHLNHKRGPAQELLLREPSFVSRKLTMTPNTRVRLLVCNSGIAELPRKKSETDFIRGLYLLCWKKQFEEIPYEIVKWARLNKVTSAITCSLIDFSDDQSCKYQALFTGHEGPEVAIFAKKVIVTTLKTQYEAFAIKKSGSVKEEPAPKEQISSPYKIKLEYVFSDDEETPAPSQKKPPAASTEAMLKAIEDQTYTLPSSTIQPGQEIPDEPLLKRKATPPIRYGSFLSSTSSHETKSSADKDANKRRRPGPKAT